MPNSPIDVSEYPTATQEDIDYLISFMDNMYNEEYPHKYIITELYTDDSGTLPLETYELHNITMECENGILIVSDMDKKLWNEKHRLHTILVEDITYISFLDDWNVINLTIGNDTTYALLN
jgi:hypothetical protein